MSRIPGAGFAGVLLIGLSTLTPAWAQTTVDGIRSLYVVTQRDARIEESHAQVALLPAAPIFVNAVGDGPLWRQADEGQGWIGRVVALGERGTQVFTEFDTATDRAQLVSSFDTSPVTPLFVDPQVNASQDAKVDAAEENGTYVSCRQVPIVGYTGPRYTFVTRYTAAGGPSWTYQFPGSTYGPARAAISRDGSRIVAGMLDSSTGQLRVVVFNAGSSVPVHSTSFTNGPQLRAFLLSDDGTTLYWASATTCNLWNVNTHQTLGTFVLMNALDCHAISADGSVFAYGGFNNVDVWERQAAGNYMRTYQWTLPGQVVCGKLDVSADGSTVVAGFNLWDANVGVVIKALDVATKTETMSDTAIGAGSLQNVVSDVAVSGNGDRFVVGLWGDEAGLVPELRFYRRDQNDPVATYDYPGSVNEVDISEDGRRVGVATKAVHANLYAGGGAIDLYTFEDEDLVVTGIPHVGGTIHVKMRSVPNAPVKLLVSPQVANVPFNWQNVGVLYLNRHTLTFTPMGTAGPHGYVERDIVLSTFPGTVGSTLCFQGLALAPRRLTQSWVRLTLLP